MNLSFSGPIRHPFFVRVPSKDPQAKCQGATQNHHSCQSTGLGLTSNLTALILSIHELYVHPVDPLQESAAWLSGRRANAQSFRRLKPEWSDFSGEVDYVGLDSRIARRMAGRCRQSQKSQSIPNSVCPAVEFKGNYWLTAEYNPRTGTNSTTLANMKPSSL